MFTFKVISFSFLLTILSQITLGIAVVAFAVFLCVAFYTYVVRPFRKITHFWRRPGDRMASLLPYPRLDR